MIKRIDVREIPLELYSESYKYLEFEVLINANKTLEPYILKLVSHKDTAYIIDNLKVA